MLNCLWLLHFKIELNEIELTVKQILFTEIDTNASRTGIFQLNEIPSKHPLADIFGTHF